MRVSVLVSVATIERLMTIVAEEVVFDGPLLLAKHHAEDRDACQVNQEDRIIDSRKPHDDYFAANVAF